MRFVATVLNDLDSFLEQVDVRIDIFRNFDDIIKVSCGSYSFENDERDCEKSKQYFDSTSVLCRCRREEREFCGEMRSGIVLCRSSSSLGWLVGTKWRRFVTSIK